MWYNQICNACVAELVDALDSKSSVSNNMSVRVRPQAPLGNLFELSELLDRYQSEMIDFFRLYEKGNLEERLVLIINVIK